MVASFDDDFPSPIQCLRQPPKSFCFDNDGGDSSCKRPSTGVTSNVLLRAYWYAFFPLLFYLSLFLSFFFYEVPKDASPRGSVAPDQPRNHCVTQRRTLLGPGGNGDT